MNATTRKIMLIGGGAAAGALIAPKIESQADLRVDTYQKQAFGAAVGGLVGLFLYYRTSLFSVTAY